ncbi:hypothetical protein DFP93_102150 [Aneurinibacillus soli]|uniref:Uncharacterized protein n=1 Tax=Aneurinibacillus soli TaxID=1500254 RepID=A0A0U5AZ88_9BACL|nr:hypothetical protein [Aneurinibacillus soli]PYE63466.1 hypothetical protein DFP93_102150 [Aneurinibacillus soli]BAU27602.1 hypothetical protein CB4_01776 [Aneurinibacillus soli]
MYQTIDIDAVTEKVADFLMQRQDRGLLINEEVFKRILADEVGVDRVDELYDRIWAQPVIRDTLEVAAMTFDLNKQVVSCGGKYFEIPGGTRDYMRDVL